MRTQISHGSRGDGLEPVSIHNDPERRALRARTVGSLNQPPVWTRGCAMAYGESHRRNRRIAANRGNMMTHLPRRALIQMWSGLNLIGIASTRELLRWNFATHKPALEGEEDTTLPDFVIAVYKIRLTSRRKSLGSPCFESERQPTGRRSLLLVRGPAAR